MGSRSFHTIYDSLNRLTAYIDAYGKSVGYEYDAHGNRTALIYPDGKRVRYTFDTANRLTKVTDWGDRATNYAWDATGLLTGTLNANGTTVGYGYDDAQRLLTLVNAKSDGSIISSYRYALDKVGNRVSSEQVEPLPVTLADSSTAYTYNAANQLQKAGAATLTFDANGNQRTQAAAGTTLSYTFDFEDRLTRVTSGASAVQYVYNGTGMRLARTENGRTTRFVLDPTSRLPRVLAETDASGNITSRYTHGLGLISKFAAEQSFQYQFDVRGSVVALTDAAQQTVNRYAYDPFGSVANSEERLPNSFKYVGQFGVYAEPHSLLFASRRFYHTASGRFLSRDPITPTDSVSQTLNPYVYALNNPIVLIDPSGLSALNPFSAAGDWISGTWNSGLNAVADAGGQALYSTGLFEYGSAGYNATNFSEGRVATAYTNAIRTAPDFLTCSATGARAQSSCSRAGYSEAEIAIARDLSDITVVVFAAYVGGPAAAIKARQY